MRPTFIKHHLHAFTKRIQPPCVTHDLCAASCPKRPLAIREIGQFVRREASSALDPVALSHGFQLGLTARCANSQSEPFVSISCCLPRHEIKSWVPFSILSFQSRLRAQFAPIESNTADGRQLRFSCRASGFGLGRNFNPSSTYLTISSFISDP